MKPEQLIDDLLSGQLNKKDALEELKSVVDLGFARLDLHREKRTGFPEVVFGAGKSFSQLKNIVKSLIEKNKPVLITRIAKKSANGLLKSFPNLNYHKDIDILASDLEKKEDSQQLFISVISAGTSDFKIAEEAAFTAEFMGTAVKRFYDVGVAGIHRLFNEMEMIKKSSVIVVVAGMDGVLPSIVGGLVDKPVIAIPTSIGYGANFNGLAPLLTMLNACASGITVVNIDNGFGGGFAAAQIIRNMKLHIKRVQSEN